MPTISGYNIIEKLYDSTNSLVYRGLCLSHNRNVILKILKDTYPSPERVAWFKREYEITRSINLEGITTMYGIENQHNHWMIVQEDFGGDSLRRLGIAGRLEIDEFLKLAIAITDIVGCIHQHHVMHKDLNPANIVLNTTTNQMKLIDFGIATILSRENPTFRNPSMLEGTLAYMSPEQAGRMNRAMDYRTDFYSLGVTFYELLTGQLPFMSDDPLEIVHSHIARQPRTPHEIVDHIPETLSAIVAKLMAKNAEDRYQSAYGLKRDLEMCLSQLEKNNTISWFTPGRHDVSDRFQIPQKLYGREKEIKKLLHAFEKVSQGDSVLMLVDGSAGIGKSALVQELYKPVTRQRGYFISGKFDQFQRNIPYFAVIQAFRYLIRHLLTESEEQLGFWRDQILQAVGKNGQVIIDVLPEIEHIIGQQPEVLSLSPAETQHRLNQVFLNFIKVFTRPEHPIVIFLDDLQWADSASLKLIEILMTAPDSHCLFVIGAYRQSEVRAGHTLWMTLDTIQESDASVQFIHLPTLELSGVTQLVFETMHCTIQEAKPLAELVITKTNGNPFFVNEFLKSLYVEGLIHFDYNYGSWFWNLQTIQSQDFTDNVVDLMASRIQRLPEKTQSILKLASCIGNQFDLKTLTFVHEQSLRDTAQDLWEAIAEGFILPLSDSYKLVEIDIEGLSDSVNTEYKFAHDRIQQAVYMLIPEHLRQALHWRIGQLLFQHISPEEREERVFDMVNQLNQGLIGRQKVGMLSTGTISLDIVLPQEEDGTSIEKGPSLEDVAELNLLAGKKAVESVAYEPALTYLRFAVYLLATDGWKSCYSLTFTAYKEYARCAWLNGMFAEAENIFDFIIEKAISNLDKADIYNTKMRLYTSMGELKGVIETGIEGLRLLGLDLDEEPTKAAIAQKVQEVETLLENHQISDLVNLPAATDPSYLAIMRLLMDILITAWWRTHMDLLYMVTLNMVHLSLRYGNTADSSVGYMWYAIFKGPANGDYESGYIFGEMSLKLNERFHNLYLEGMLDLLFGVFVHFWRYPLYKSLEYLKHGYQVGIDTGNLLWAGINGYAAIYTMLIKGDRLDDVYDEVQHYLEFARSTKQVIPLNMLTLSQQFILSLKGLTREPWSFSDDVYNEEHHVEEISRSEAFRPLFWYYKTKLQSLFLFEQFEQALDVAQKLNDVIDSGAAFGNVTSTEHYFYYSLTLLALYKEAPATKQQKYWNILQQNQEHLKCWMENCPSNFQHKYLLVEAEIARIQQKDELAMLFYEQAIGLAHDHGFTQVEALSHELAARYYLSQSNVSSARDHLVYARNLYFIWGATAKAKALSQSYEHLLLDGDSITREHAPLLSDGRVASTPSITTSSGLDISTVVKASQAISGEIVLDTLLSNLMQIVIENAGAEWGVLILEQDGKWMVEAKGHVDRQEVTVLQSTPVHIFTEIPSLPLSIINYVIRTKEHVVLNNAMSEGQFMHDRYITTYNPHSVLCAPLINQGQLMGMLYLENNLATGAFTPDRLEILNLLASQATISLKNAVLYNNIEKSEEKYRNLFENSRDTIFITTTDGEIVDMNGAGLDLFGYSREEMMQLNALELYNLPEEREQFRQIMGEKGSVRDYQIQYLRKDGRIIDCLLTATVRRTSDGSISGYEGIIRDITAQKQAEAERAALLDEQARKAGELQAIIESMADGLLVVDRYERIVLVNPVAASLFARQPDELMNHPLSCLSAVDDPVMESGLQHIVNEVRHELCNEDYEFPEGCISLGKSIVRTQIARTYGSGSTLTGAVVVIQDVTSSVEADRAKSAFIATASHELRTPLASMKGFVDLFYLSGTQNLNDNQQLFMDTIRRQTNSLVVLVNDLLEVARFEQGNIRAENRWVSLSSAIEECVVGLSSQSQKRHVDVQIEVSPDIPSVWIDPLHLRRILMNLVSNAVKYVHEYGSVWVKVYKIDDMNLLPSTPPLEMPWQFQDPHSIVIEVLDNGVGIRQDDQEKIFTRFFRSENPLTVEAGGTGLGLAITRSLVELHHGQIGFWSEEGKGSCFWLRLPMPQVEMLEDEKG